MLFVFIVSGYGTNRKYFCAFEIQMNGVPTDADIWTALVSLETSSLEFEIILDNWDSDVLPVMSKQSLELKSSRISFAKIESDLEPAITIWYL